FVASLSTQAVGPLDEAVAHRRIEALDLFGCQLLRQQQRRQWRFKKNFVGVSVADSAQQTWIRQCSFQGVVRRRENFREGRQIRLQHFNAARIESGESLSSR